MLYYAEADVEDSLPNALQQYPAGRCFIVIAAEELEERKRHGKALSTSQSIMSPLEAILPEMSTDTDGNEKFGEIKDDGNRVTYWLQVADKISETDRQLSELKAADAEGGFAGVADRVDMSMARTLSQVIALTLTDYEKDTVDCTLMVSIHGVWRALLSMSYSDPTAILSKPVMTVLRFIRDFHAGFNRMTMCVDKPDELAFITDTDPQVVLDKFCTVATAGMCRGAGSSILKRFVEKADALHDSPGALQLLDKTSSIVQDMVDNMEHGLHR